MAWVYADLKAADRALSPAISDPAAAAAVINAQTVPGPTVSVSIAAIHGVMMLAVGGDWLKIRAMAATTHSVSWQTAPQPQDSIISAAQLAIELAESKVSMVDPPNWPGFLAFLGTLQKAGLVGADTMATVTAMGTPNATVPKWVPAVTAGDMQTARNQP